MNRFSAEKVGLLLKDKLEQNMDQHQHRDEFIEGCLQCEKCRLIRQIAQDSHNTTIMRMIFGKPPRTGHSAFVRGMHGERLLTDDTDMRVRGRTRAGK